MASIKKINERKYKITVSNGYRPDGRKICKAKTITVPDSVKPRGISQYVTHEAEEFERFVKNGFGEDASIKFEDYAERWLTRQHKYAPSTLGMYRRMLKVAYKYIGQIELGKLRPIALENMLTELRKRKYRGKYISEETVQKYLTAVSAVLSDAKKNEIISKNPARMIDLPDTERKIQCIPSAEEAQEIIACISSEPFHFCVFYMMAIYTGCRRGELCALKWSDFEMIKGNGAILHIRGSRSVAAGIGIVEGKTKNGKERSIYISDDFLYLIILYLSMKSGEAQRAGRQLSPYVFTDEHGNPMHPDTYTKRLRRLYDRSGFPKEYHLHTLRHYFVSTLLHGGVDKQTVAELAGHGDTSFLERTYCHPQMSLKYQAASVMYNSLLSVDEYVD